MLATALRPTTFTSTFNFTAANGYLQSYSGLQSLGTTGDGTTLNPTTTSVIITGNVTNQMQGFGSGHYDTLTLAGSSTGNAIQGRSPTRPAIAA